MGHHKMPCVSVCELRRTGCALRQQLACPPGLLCILVHQNLLFAAGGASIPEAKNGPAAPSLGIAAMLGMEVGMTEGLRGGWLGPEERGVREGSVGVGLTGSA